MGVRGLQAYLESNCSQGCYNINIGKIAEEYHRKTGKTPLIIVDGMSCLKKLYGKLNWICGGQWKGYVENVTNFVKSLKAHGIRLVFFFDGNTPERKREGWAMRRLENLEDVDYFFTLMKAHKDVVGQQFFLPTELAAFTPIIIKDVLGCQVHTSLDECDKTVADYAKKHGAMGILGQDSDYVIYNTAHYYFSINHLNLETLDTMVYDRASMCRFLEINIDQLPLLSCLIGNDIIRQEHLTLFHKQAMKEAHARGHHSRSNRPPPEILIPKVAGFIKDNAGSMDQINTQLPNLAKAVFHDAMRAGMLEAGLKMYKIEPDSVEEFDPERIDDPSMDIIDRVRQRHVNSLLGRHLYTVLRGEPYESSTTLEDYSGHLPSGVIIFQLLRARMYRTLQKSITEHGKDQKSPEGMQPLCVHKYFYGWSRVTEWCMYSGAKLKEPDFTYPEEWPGGNTPTLQELWDGSHEYKMESFFRCIHAELGATGIRDIDPRLIVPMCIIFYLQCSQPRPILKDWEAAVMIATFISPIHEEMSQIRAVMLPRIDARAVHLAAVFMKGLVTMYFLLSVADFPFPRLDAMPWKFWDGKVFHHYYLRCKCGTRVEEVLDNREDLLKVHRVCMKIILSKQSPRTEPKPKLDADGNVLSASSSLQSSPEHRTATPCDSPLLPSSPAKPPSTLAINKNAPGGRNAYGGSPSGSPSKCHKSPAKLAKSPVAKRSVATASPIMNRAKSPTVCKSPARRSSTTSNKSPLPPISKSPANDTKPSKKSES